MNVYPPWWDKSITLFNKMEAANGTVTWYPTVISNAYVKNAGQSVVVNNGVIDTDKAICRIRKDPNYLPKAEWDALAVKSSKFTLAPGDIIIFGSVTDTINEYVAGSRSTDLLNKYASSGAMEIESVNINVGNGLGNEHYHVVGR